MKVKTLSFNASTLTTAYKKLDISIEKSVRILKLIKHSIDLTLRNFNFYFDFQKIQLELQAQVANLYIDQCKTYHCRKRCTLVLRNLFLSEFLLKLALDSQFSILTIRFVKVGDL